MTRPFPRLVKKFFLTLLVALSTGLGQVSLTEAAQRPFRIVLDPGHGGADEGTVHIEPTGRITEKDVTLILAQQTAKKLRSHGFEVFLTREGDIDLALSARTAMANRLKADVFISLHMNASAIPGAKDAFGIETYFLNSTSDESSKRLAHFENSVLGGSPKSPDSPEELDVALILKDLRLDANLSESKRLACHLQHQLVQYTSNDPAEVVATSPRNRGIKQALFYVLLGADMPAVLVEAGFLSRNSDRNLVLALSGQQKIASAITAALERFRTLKGTQQAKQVVSTCKVR
ncbi:MAG: N-acetylmuramoyl-L-alanine amidase [Bdellovibrionales bacterium]|nr:N-acetylmuramoyl-L-alanine amidase [Bdellovibrionales bacterium]